MDTPATERFRVFVYGSLKKGLGLHHALEKQTFIGEDTLTGYHMMSLHSYPAIYATGHIEDNIVHGEVYEVDQKCLAHLDYVEGHPNFYKRTKVELNTQGSAFTYTHEYPKHRQTFERVLGGHWKGPAKTPCTVVRNASYSEKPRAFYDRETNKWLQSDNQGHLIELPARLEHPLYVRPPLTQQLALPPPKPKEDESLDACTHYWGPAVKVGQEEKAKKDEVIPANEKEWNGHEVSMQRDNDFPTC